MNRPNHPPGYPVAGPPSPEPRKPRKPKSRNAKLFGIGIAALIVLAGFGFYQGLNGPIAARPGDCIKVDDIDEARVEQVDCGSADAVYRVALNLDDSELDCPNGDYTSYSESGRRSADLRLCLTLNAKAGDCFKAVGQVDVRADCAKDAEFQVTKVIENSDDPKKCGGPKKAKNALSYPDPKLTLCVAPLQTR